MAAATLKGPLSCEAHDFAHVKRSRSGRRRVFVQTETGCVVGLDLFASDNAHTVKRRLQLALNVPTEEASLVCGDLVLKNDLSTVRNDAPLLLTRSGMHRSSSTPCLSPSGSDFQETDQSGPVEVIGSCSHSSKARKLVRDVVKGIECGIHPVPISGGLGGAYFFKNRDGVNAAIVKPTDEEPFAPNNPKGFVGKALGLPGLKHSVRVGETGYREVAAYLLDHDSFAKVPLTAIVKVTHSVFNENCSGIRGTKNSEKKKSKIASFQQFICHDFEASDYGTSSFPVSAVHRIGILDVRILNTDRHAGNLLVRKLGSLGGVERFDQVDLIPIDHGLCLPEELEDPYFEWIHWPQASIPFSEDELEYIENLDPFYDSEMLRMELPGIREACLRVLVVCTIFLKEAARFGLCLAEIGEMMSREFQGQDAGPSELEMICIEATNVLKAREFLAPLNTGDSDEDLFDLDRGDDFPGNKGIGCSSLFRLDESDEDDVLEEDIISETKPKTGVRVESVAKNTMTVKGGMKKWRSHRNATLEGYVAGISSGKISINKQLQSVSSYVKMADMEEEEWSSFLRVFQRLMKHAFSERRAGKVGFRQIQRLGTSCKF